MINQMKEELLTRMINIFGFEHPEVVNFAHLIEINMPFTFLLALVSFYEAMPQDDEEI